MKMTYIIGVVIVVVVIAAIAVVLTYPMKPSQCQDPDVVAVSSCTDGSLKVMSGAAGAGFKVIKPDGTEISCPVIAQPSDECLNALDICSDDNLC